MPDYALAFLIYGFVMGIVYDFFRFLRFVFKNKAASFLLDFLFFAVYNLLVKNRKVRLSVVSVLLVVMFFGCAVAIVSQMADINRLKNQEAAYTQQLADQKEENAELEEILDSDDRDAYIEQKAREKGYVKSDEIVFYDISGSGN